MQRIVLITQAFTLALQSILFTIDRPLS